MPKCKHCPFDSADDFDAYSAHIKTCDKDPRNKKGVTQPKPVVTHPTFNTVGNATLRDIAAQGRPNDTFYLAANQSLVNLLSHERNGKSEPHTSFFKNMVATIILETAGREPGEHKAKQYNDLLTWEIAIFNRQSKAIQLILLRHLWACCYQREIPHTPASASVHTNAQSAAQIADRRLRALTAPAYGGGSGGAVAQRIRGFGLVAEGIGTFQFRGM